MTKSVEERIREHYQASSGEWLIEKGKIKEAKLLKEACECIEELRSLLDQKEKYINKKEIEGWHNILAHNKRKEELDKREENIKYVEERLNDRLQSVHAGISEWLVLTKISSWLFFENLLKFQFN